MSISFYGIIVAVVALMASTEGMIYLLLISTMFGGTAALILGALGGASITPAVFTQPFLIGQQLRKFGLKAWLESVTFLSPGFWLLLLTGWGFIATFIMPRLFEGQFLVFVPNREAGGTILAPIAPTSSNITQSMYAAIGLLTYLSTSTLLRSERVYEVISRAILWTASLNALAGILNLAQSYSGIPMLSLLKNANYATLDGEVGGLARISGMFAETSSYSQFTLTLLAATQTLWMNNVHLTWSRRISLIGLLLLFLSTSGTAYVGLSICYLVGSAFAIRNITRHGTLGKYKIYGWSLLVMMVGLTSAIILNPSLLDILLGYFDATLGTKLESESGRTRSTWNAMAIQNFFDSYGLGTGIGSNIASSFLLVLLSNTGWVGIFCFAMFAWTVFSSDVTRSSEPSASPVILAARSAAFACIVGAAISARVYDIGNTFYALMAIGTLRQTRSLTPP
jgi:hypothetical protein